VHRDEARILRKLKVAAITAGEDWFYHIPVRAKRGLTFVEGPSIKMTSDLARLYGNCVVETHVTDLGYDWVVEARFSDLETGYSLSRPHQQGKPREGREDLTSRVLESALQAAISKAIRNVVATALPTFTEFGLKEARRVVLSSLKADLEAERSRTVSTMADVIAVEDGEALLGRPVALWSAAEVHQLRSVLRALNDGMLGIRDLALPSSRGGNSRPETKEGTADALSRFAAAATATPVVRDIVLAQLPSGPTREPENGNVEVASPQLDASPGQPAARKWNPSEPRNRRNRARKRGLRIVREGVAP
jgi:hypothetical protein